MRLHIRSPGRQGSGIAQKMDKLDQKSGDRTASQGESSGLKDNYGGGEDSSQNWSVSPDPCNRWVLLLPGVVSHIAHRPMEWWWSLVRFA